MNKADKSRTKLIRKQIKTLEKIKNNTEEKGIIEGSNDLDYLTLLQEVKSRKVGIFDFFYREEQVVDKKLKVIEDVLYSSRTRTELIVRWLENVGKKHRDTKFDVGKLISVFGEKTGRQILQSLFSAKTIKSEIICEAAYKNLWNNFRKSLNTSDENKKISTFLVQDGIKQFHYVVDLLNEANILR